MTPGAMVPVGDDGEYLCVPALTFQQLTKYREKLKAIIATANFLTIDAETLDDFVGIACAAVKRNHPAITPVKLFELLDLRSAQIILIALLGSGKYVMPEAADDEEMHRAADEVIGVCFNGRSADA